MGRRVSPPKALEAAAARAGVTPKRLLDNARTAAAYRDPENPNLFRFGFKAGTGSETHRRLAAQPDRVALVQQPGGIGQLKAKALVSKRKRAERASKTPLAERARSSSEDCFARVVGKAIAVARRAGLEKHRLRSIFEAVLKDH